MKIEGSIQANMLSAIVSSRRLRGQRVHKDTLAYWHAILEQGRRAGLGPFKDDVSHLVDELAFELAQFDQDARSRPRLKTTGYAAKPEPNAMNRAAADVAFSQVGRRP